MKPDPKHEIKKLLESINDIAEVKSPLLNKSYGSFYQEHPKSQVKGTEKATTSKKTSTGLKHPFYHRMVGEDAGCCPCLKNAAHELRKLSISADFPGTRQDRKDFGNIADKLDKEKLSQIRHIIMNMEEFPKEFVIDILIDFGGDAGQTIAKEMGFSVKKDDSNLEESYASDFNLFLKEYKEDSKKKYKHTKPASNEVEVKNKNTLKKGECIRLQYVMPNGKTESSELCADYDGQKVKELTDMYAEDHPECKDFHMFKTGKIGKPAKEIKKPIKNKTIEEELRSIKKYGSKKVNEYGSVGTSTGVDPNYYVRSADSQSPKNNTSTTTTTGAPKGTPVSTNTNNPQNAVQNTVPNNAINNIPGLKPNQAQKLQQNIAVPQKTGNQPAGQQQTPGSQTQQDDMQTMQNIQKDPQLAAQWKNLVNQARTKAS